MRQVNPEEGDGTSTRLWQTLVVDVDHVVCVEMPPDRKPQDLLSQELVRAWLQQIVMMSSSTMSVGWRATKEDLAGSRLALCAWLSTPLDTAMSDIVGVKFGIHLLHNIVIHGQSLH